MIEKVFIAEKLQEVRVKRFLEQELEWALVGKIDIIRTPIGEKIIIHSALPARLAGRRKLLNELERRLKEEFGLKNPQIEVKDISETENPYLNPKIVAGIIAKYMKRNYARPKVKAFAYNILREIMNAGAKGAEIRLKGRLGGKRRVTITVRAGYIPKNGYVSDFYVRRYTTKVVLVPGVVGITVTIFPSGVRMPDEIRLKEEAAHEGERAEAEKHGGAEGAA